MSLKVVIAANNSASTASWKARFESACPDVEFFAWSEGQPAVDADYAIVWKPPGKVFEHERSLKAVFNLGAGVDALIALPELPKTLPVVRLEDAGMAPQMLEYVLHGLVNVSRGFDQYEGLQRAGKWQPLDAIRYSDWPVGVMGLGAIGRQVAQGIARAGYPVAGWSRSPRQLAGVECYSSAAELPAFLGRTRVLVNVLPLTPETENILDRQALEMLLPDGYVINVARGSHVVDEDLLALIDNGHLRGALLDVFRTEPLPAEHPYWKHGKVRMTPHIAAMTLEDESVQQVMTKIKRLERNEPITGIVARDAGY